MNILHKVDEENRLPQSQPEALRLRVHDLVFDSRANGPGLRAVLWVQGCTLGCQGCFNPETHSFAAGSTKSTSDLLKEITSHPSALEGLTISGGEPLQQLAGLLQLLKLVRKETNLSVILFSGFSLSEIDAMPGKDELFSLIDVLVAGRYEHERRIASGLIGSANKASRFFTDRYCESDLCQTPCAEIIIAADGTIVLSGIDPMLLNQTSVVDQE